MNVLNKGYNKIIILSPYWRCGSVLLSALTSQDQKIENLDEIFDQVHPWQNIEWPEFVSKTNFVWNTVDEYKMLYEKYLEQTSIDIEWQKKFKVNYNFNNLLKTESKYVFKVHGDQCLAFRKVFHESLLKEMAQNKNVGFVLLYRKDLTASILSMAIGLKNDHFHSKNLSTFLPCHKTQSPKTNFVYEKETADIKKMFNIILNHHVPYSIKHFNETLLYLKNLNIKFDDILLYEKFKSYDFTSAYHEPYKTNNHYQDLYKTLEKKLLRYNQNQFVIENS